MKIPQYCPTTGRWICRVGIADIMLLAYNTDCVYGIESKVETGDGSEFFSSELSCIIQLKSFKQRLD